MTREQELGVKLQLMNSSIRLIEKELKELFVLYTETRRHKHMKRFKKLKGVLLTKYRKMSDLIPLLVHDAYTDNENTLAEMKRIKLDKLHEMRRRHQNELEDVQESDKYSEHDRTFKIASITRKISIIDGRIKND